MSGETPKVLSAVTPVAGGIAVLPNTGGHTILGYVAITAIVLGTTALVLQLSVTLYRLSLRRR
jgi:hypothetical protein